MSDDEQFLTDLADAVRAAAEVPARFVETGKAAFAWRDIDAELAELTYDSATQPSGALAGARADPAAMHAVTFLAGGLTIEVEVTAEALQGQLVPPESGQIELQRRDGPPGTAPVDTAGWFIFTPPPAPPYRLHLRTADGRRILTEWITY
jgi:limonene-1,2-epoxide hydrolase